MKYKVQYLILILIWPLMLEWITCNGVLALILFSNGFLVVLLAWQYLQVDIPILVNWPRIFYLVSLFILSCPIYPSLPCHIIKLSYIFVEVVINE